MSFDKDITAIVPKKSGLRLSRTPSMDTVIEKMAVEHSAEGLTLVSLQVGNEMVLDVNRQGMPLADAKIDFPIRVPKKTHFFLALHNPTDNPIAIRWKIKVKKILFAVALERKTAKEWQPDILYAHALKPEHAIAHVLGSELDKKNVRIVGASKVIGYHVDDKDGKILSV